MATTPVIASFALSIHSTKTVCSCCVSIALMTFRNVHASGIPFSSFKYFRSHVSLLLANNSTLTYYVALHITAASMMNSTPCNGYHMLYPKRISSIPSIYFQQNQFFHLYTAPFFHGRNIAYFHLLSPPCVPCSHSVYPFNYSATAASTRTKPRRSKRTMPTCGAALQVVGPSDGFVTYGGSSGCFPVVPTSKHGIQRYKYL